MKRYHDVTTISRAKAAMAEGISAPHVARYTGIPRATISGWRSGAVRGDVQPDPAFRAQLRGLLQSIISAE